MGEKKSKKKAKQSAINGRLGGRPRGSVNGIHELQIPAQTKLAANVTKTFRKFPNTTNTYAKQAWFFGAACSDQLLLEHTGSSLDLPR
jgi:hypothetical protein